LTIETTIKKYKAKISLLAKNLADATTIINKSNNYTKKRQNKTLIFLTFSNTNRSIKLYNDEK